MAREAAGPSPSAPPSPCRRRAALIGEAWLASRALLSAPLGGGRHETRVLLRWRTARWRGGSVASAGAWLSALVVEW
jgi:hypothetical protein